MVGTGFGAASTCLRCGLPDSTSSPWSGPIPRAPRAGRHGPEWRTGSHRLNAVAHRRRRGDDRDTARDPQDELAVLAVAPASPSSARSRSRWHHRGPRPGRGGRAGRRHRLRRSRVPVGARSRRCSVACHRRRPHRRTAARDARAVRAVGGRSRSPHARLVVRPARAAVGSAPRARTSSISCGCGWVSSRCRRRSLGQPTPGHGAEDSFTVKARMPNGCDVVMQQTAGAYGSPTGMTRVAGQEGTVASMRVRLARRPHRGPPLPVADRTCASRPAGPLGRPEHAYTHLELGPYTACARRCGAGSRPVPPPRRSRSDLCRRPRRMQVLDAIRVLGRLRGRPRQRLDPEVNPGLVCR